jgi:protein-L-isoaspartate(D-aspartate) O-methyltransferase
VELEPDLVSFGSANLAATHQDWARIVAAVPGSLGWPDEAPYHRILVSAAPRTLPAELVDQLVSDRDDPGRMVIPVAGEMLLVVRTGPSGEDAAVSRHGFYRFVPLR